MKWKYGLTEGQYKEMLSSQGGGCAICGTKEPGGRGGYGYLMIDHCHTTGKIRGLLCNGCNRALGYMGDSPEIADRCAEYLRRN